MSNVQPEGDIILVVDDSPEALSFIMRALEDAGVNVLVATSGENAIAIAGQIAPDVVLMDAVMPGMDGFETCRRMKALPGIAHIPVIFMTALTEAEHIVHALDSGGVDYLSKPINLDELRARIRVHLAGARRTQSARVALDAAGRHLMAFSVKGAVQWSTPQAQRLVAGDTMPDDAAARISTRVRHWLEGRDVTALIGEGLTVPLTSASSVQLLFLGMVTADEYLFRLMAEDEAGQEQTLRDHFGLTVRESEVLMWIARGKSNRDIAQVLDISPRTINKHLEQIYTKLGVENRATAAIKAMQALNP